VSAKFAHDSQKDAKDGLAGQRRRSPEKRDAEKPQGTQRNTGLVRTGHAIWLTYRRVRLTGPVFRLPGVRAPA
jgi:hypothetical protein